MVILELIARTALLFSQPPFIAAIAVIGFLNRNERIFGYAIFLTTFTMIYNVYLKNIWQIPLPQPLEGYAFPSGHMHTAVVFWGWLAYAFRNFIFSVLIFFILCLVGYGMIYQGYHYPIDVVGAVGFGSLSLFIFTRIQKWHYFKDKPYLLGIPMTLLGITFLLMLPPEARKPHVWQAAGISSGFTIGWAILSQRQALTLSHFQKILSIALALGGATLLLFFVEKLPFPSHFNTLVAFFTLSIWVGSCKRLIPAKAPL